MRRNANATATTDSATAQLVSPSEPNTMEVKMENTNLNKNLFQFMTSGGEEEDEGANCSPPKEETKVVHQGGGEAHPNGEACS